MCGGGVVGVDRVCEPLGIDLELAGKLGQRAGFDQVAGLDEAGDVGGGAQRHHQAQAIAAQEGFIADQVGGGAAIGEHAHDEVVVGVRLIDEAQAPAVDCDQPWLGTV
ncbi:hypothetical protein D3C79_864450 [compost metagenome]